MKIIKHGLLVFGLVLFLTGCAQITRHKTIRTITLDGKSYSENEPGQFFSWGCRDYVYGGRVIIELGQLNDGWLDGMTGFVLYDGTDAGELAIYQRRGLNHTYSWGNKFSDYTFIIKPDGTGAYYDFSNTKEGDAKKPEDIYKCKKT